MGIATRFQSISDIRLGPLGSRCLFPRPLHQPFGGDLGPMGPLNLLAMQSNLSHMRQ